MILRRRFSVVELPSCPEKANFAICRTEFTKITSLNYAMAIIFNTRDHFCVHGVLDSLLSALRGVGHTLTTTPWPPPRTMAESELAEDDPKAKIFCRGIALNMGV